MVFQYSLGRKVSSVSNSARVIQFPMRLCFATTSHKFQGQSVHKPNKIVVDLRTVFTAALAYVILSRVQKSAQLFILWCVPRKKIFAYRPYLDLLEFIQTSKPTLKVFSYSPRAFAFCNFWLYSVLPGSLPYIKYSLGVNSSIVTTFIFNFIVNSAFSSFLTRTDARMHTGKLTYRGGTGPPKNKLLGQISSL